MLSIVVGFAWLLSVYLQLTGVVTLLCDLGMITGGVLVLKGRRAGRLLCLVCAPIALVLATMTLLVPALQTTVPLVFAFNGVMVAALLVLVVLVFSEHLAVND
ncbi:hypothetical protein SAMN05192558_11315 [Actinokineospora alba]|uniref:Uncharacterized protein n=1 Tax=Actinokineospora alba TaxID=504798 RepID=A0A1H0V5T3_9PSEU|nr:hypothetical protein C8E96_0949 [Actinokineospora alba]SDH63018.1 hypothetical protein SAMN05421871_101769 [Actinokineospora alba]SDP73476.1 hypothetical protein SAMN05192558_11315 [Actinokineospora alba]